MDLVDFSEERFTEIVHEFEGISSKMMVKDVQYIPISALNGDNVVNRSENMDWFLGAPLLHTLETLHISSDINKLDARFPVQTVIRPQTTEFIDYRGYAGRIASGIFRPNDEVVILPSGITSTIKSIDLFDQKLDVAYAPMSVSITLNDDVDVSRGDVIVPAKNQPQCVTEMEAMICWLNKKPARS